jgi:hypothetical protein
MKGRRAELINEVNVYLTVLKCDVEYLVKWPWRCS